MKEPLKVQDRNGSIFWLEEFTAGPTIVWQPQLGRGPRVSLAYAQLYATAKKLNLSEPVLERATQLAVLLAVAQAPSDEVEVTLDNLWRAAEA